MNSILNGSVDLNRLTVDSNYSIKLTIDNESGLIHASHFMKMSNRNLL